MEIIKPDLLKKLIQHGKPITCAVGMLNSRWGNVIAKYGSQTQIDATTVILARELVQSGLFKSSLDFNDYGSVKRYLIKNDVYMSNSGRHEMLKTFQE